MKKGQQHICGEPRWWRGNLHTHTFWSDGKAFPDEAAALYKAHGYHFLGLSDHNVFQDDPARWIQETRRERYFADYLAAFPGAEVRIGADGVREARLSTFSELAERFDEPGRFLLMPTIEATRSVQFPDGRRHEVHMNYANIPKLLPSLGVPDFKRVADDVPISEFISRHAEEVGAVARSTGAARHLFIVNHPIWQWYDVAPEDIAESSAIRYFEVCNNGTEIPSCPDLPQDGFDADRFWDVVNAFRARRGLPLLFGTGSDDTHCYRGESHGGMLMPFNAWILVRSPSLDAESIIGAMETGDFFACEGLEPEDVSFEPSSGTLSVSVAARPGVAQAIRFIVSKKDFSEVPVRTMRVRPPTETDNPCHERTIRVYDDRIGMVAKSVHGGVGQAVRASYTLAPDDLYVRARIEAPGQPLCTANMHPRCLAAWTQPYSA